MTFLDVSDLHTIIKLSDIEKTEILGREDFVDRVHDIEDFFGYSVLTDEMEWHGDVYKLIDEVWQRFAREIYPQTVLPVKSTQGWVAYRLTFGQTYTPGIPAQDLSMYLRSDRETKTAFLASIWPDDPHCRSDSIPLEARALYVSTIELAAGRTTPPERTERIYLRMSWPH